MKKILVPTDFSETANNALEFAIQTAKLFPAEITLLHSYEVIQSYSTDYFGANLELTQKMLKEIQTKLDQIKEKVVNVEKIEIKTLIATNALTDAIKTAHEQNHYDMIIMGTLGASGISEKIWGSRTSSIIGKSEIPVMVIPNDYKWKKPKKILFLTNQFEKEPKILNYIFETTNLFMANIMVSVFTDTDDEKTEIYLKHQSNMGAYSNFLKTAYKEDTLTSIHLTGKEFGETLQAFIKENEIDMIIMVTYPRGAWKTLFQPSKTKKMSFHTQIPLLTITAPK